MSKSLLEKAKLHTVLPRSILGESDGRYCVVSHTSGRMYDVILKGNIKTCNCQCGYMSNAVCSHLMAAALTAIEKKGYGVVGIERGDKPPVPHFKLNFNTYLLVQPIEEIDYGISASALSKTSSNL